MYSMYTMYSLYSMYSMWHPFETIIFQETLKTFVEENFSAAGTELEEVTPVDWLEDPQFLNDISDENLKQLAAEMNGAWKNLTRYKNLS